MSLSCGRLGERESDGSPGRGRRLAAVGAALATSLLAAAGAAEPPRSRPTVAATAENDERIKQAKTLNEEAEELYTHGQYRAAIAKLEVALKLDPDGKVLVYDLAIAHERLAQFEVAETYYRRYLDMETDLKARERVKVALQRIEGAKKEIPPPAPPPPSPRRAMSPWVFPAAGVAATALCIGAVLGISALSTDPSANATTGPGVTVDDLFREAERAHRQAIVADVFFVISAAAAGAALYFYISSPRPEPAKGQTRAASQPVAIRVGAERAFLRVIF
jgi:tetratricopeptide (TPR) repeat protein